MNSLILLAAMGDILQMVGVAVFFLLWALGPILKGIAERNAKLARDAQRGKKAPGQPGAQDAGAPNPRAEVERFLREVARKGGDRDDAPATISAEIVLGEDDLLQPPPRRRPANKKDPSRRVSPAGEGIESRRLIGTLRDRPEHHSQLELADEKMAEHVHDVFDHNLGQLGATTEHGVAPAPDTQVAGMPSVAGTAIPTSASSVRDLLRDPATVRQAILIHEILGPPRCESTDIGRSD